MPPATFALPEGLQSYLSPIFVVLVATSVAVLGLGIERLVGIRRCRVRLREGRRIILAHLAEGSTAMACAVNRTCAWHPAVPVLELVLAPVPVSRARIVRGQHQIVRRTRRRVWLLGSAGSVAPFVGLLGTVTGIMTALRAMSAQGAGGIAVVSAGLSDALATTAAGIFVGIESMLLFNALQVALAGYAAELRESVDEVVEAMPRGGGSPSTEPALTGQPRPGLPMSAPPDGGYPPGETHGGARS